MEQQALLLKKLLYRSTKRGCKETDLLLGEFAKARLTSLRPNEITIYEQLVEEDDASIYDWLLEKQPPPAKYQTLLDQIMSFHKMI